MTQHLDVMRALVTHCPTFLPHDQHHKQETRISLNSHACEFYNNRFRHLKIIIFVLYWLSWIHNQGQNLLTDPLKTNNNNNNKKKTNTIGSLQVMRGHVTINQFKENHPLTVFDN